MSGGYDYLSNLQEITWNGITAPCLETSFDGGHDQAERKYPYVDGAGHDNTGRNPYVVRATLVFNNSVAPDLLPARLERWLQALENGGIGYLEHPMLGNFAARVQTWNARVDPSQDRGGIRLDVQWTESLVDPTAVNVRTQGNQLSYKGFGYSLDQALEDIQYEVPTSLGSSSFEGALNKMEQLPRESLEFQREADRIASISDTITVDLAVRDVLRELPVQWLSEGLTMALRAQAATASTQRLRNTQQRTLPYDISLDSFAREMGNSFEDVLGLNVSLVTSPIIKAGTTLVYYGSGNA